MALHMPTFLKRTGSAIVYAAIMVCGLTGSIDAILCLLALLSVLCLHEYFKLLKHINPDKHWPIWVQAIVHAISLYLLAFFVIPFGFGGSINTPLYILYTLLLLAFPFMLGVSILSKKDSLHAVLLSGSGLLYITVPLVLLGLMHDDDAFVPLAVLVMIWVNDTMAYIVGSLIGKTPLSPVSPKKTWEGTVGGALLTIGVAAAFSFLADSNATTEFSRGYPVGVSTFGLHTQKLVSLGNSSMLHWIMIALIVAVAGSLGDLFESKLKRLANVKDSGNIMPGHGGALDRLDSLLFAVPFVYVYCSFFIHS